MKCHLCHEEKKLIKAHIIPKWAFMYLYPKSKSQPLMLVGSRANKRSRIGIYDSDILCKECDGFIGTYDDYGKQIILEKTIEDSEFRGLAYLIKDIDPLKLKIFLLSVLWRASISKREEVKSISLGPFENKIRDTLRKIKEKQDANLELNGFSILFSKFGKGIYPDIMDKNIQLPLFTRINGVNFNVLYFPHGFKIYIKIDKRPIGSPFNKIELRETNVLVLGLKDFQDSKEFDQMRVLLRKYKSSI